MNIFRRLPLSRLLLLCGAVVLAGISVTAIASALSSGPTPPQKPLAQAVHDALAAPAVKGFSAHVKFTNRLLEGANLASGTSAGEAASSPLLNGASGRIWVSADGRVRLELQAEKGDTEIIYDGHTIQLYEPASNTLYRYTPEAGTTGSTSTAPAGRPDSVPSVAKIEEAIAHLTRHADLSGAQPTDVAGRAAYTVRISPKEGGSLLGGAELSFDAANGTPLRTAVYAAGDSSPVMELAAEDASYGEVESSVFQFSAPPGAKVEEVKLPKSAPAHGHTGTGAAGASHVRTHGSGLGTIAVLEAKSKGASGASSALESLPKVQIGSVSASELRTELGTILTFERSGIRYVVAGSATPAAVEAVAKGL